MTDSHIEQTSEADTFFAALRQADIFENVGNLFPTDEAHVIVISQTCDVVLPKRPMMSFAALVTLDEAASEAARRPDNPRYLHIAANTFVDLCHIFSVAKEAVAGAKYERGIDQQDDIKVREFALAVGRWFSRFPFPDAIVPWLSPIQSTIRQKYEKTSSPLGQILQKVVELRVQADTWAADHIALELHVILKAGTLPTLEGIPDMRPGFRNKLYASDDKVKTPSEVAEGILYADSTDELNLAWDAFAASLAEACKPKPIDMQKSEIANAVSEITGVLWSEDDFPLSRVRKSEILDIDYLSGPTPL
ncbi:hypothetical protein LIX22_000487 [Clavibacter nebraskensis]|uniref:hypothetical protein n=1 Tax=Clavibacter nebraskensis TaxID=31963 RepID=UPI00200FF73E|nr:hypothetical protein [Clavibacter nebraskensis]UQB16773.1 hypothetical protein LIX22_000487 [Clavibacter nebraskensis]